MIFDVLNRIQRIDYLIRIKGTGNATELAEKLGLSRTSVYEYLDLMKKRGAPIKYSYSRKSYYYEEAGSFFTDFRHDDDIDNKQINNLSKVVFLTLLLGIA